VAFAIFMFKILMFFFDRIYWIYKIGMSIPSVAQSAFILLILFILSENLFSFMSVWVRGKIPSLF